MVKGYTQEHGIDYTKVFAPVARMDIVWMIIGFAAQKGWKLHQLDVKSAFFTWRIERRYLSRTTKRL